MDVFLEDRTSDSSYTVLPGVSPDLTDEHPEHLSSLIRHAVDVVDTDRGHETAGPEHISDLRFDAETDSRLVLRTNTELVVLHHHIHEGLQRLDQLVAAGFDPTTPERLDVAGERVAVATPLDRAPSAPAADAPTEGA
jgi:hypothetical protein